MRAKLGLPTAPPAIKIGWQTVAKAACMPFLSVHKLKGLRRGPIRLERYG